jgi:hypothetical protein
MQPLRGAQQAPTSFSLISRRGFLQTAPQILHAISAHLIFLTKRSQDLFGKVLTKQVRKLQDGGGAFLMGDSDYLVFTFGSNKAGGQGGGFKLVGSATANFIATGALLSNQAGVSHGML